MVVVVGLAVTLAPVVALKPVLGDQVYVFAPLAVSVVLAPLQMLGEFTLTVGIGKIVTVAVAVFKHPFTAVPVIVYVVVVVGFAVTLAPVVALSPVLGDQVYVFAPLAVSVALAPLQILGELTVIVGNGRTVTVVVVVFKQPLAAVPVIVYVVVVVGFAVTLTPVVALNPVLGDQL